MTQIQKAQEEISVETLMQRWDCSRATVYHYINNGKRGVKLKTKFSMTQYTFTEEDVLAFENAVKQKAS